MSLLARSLRRALAAVFSAGVVVVGAAGPAAADPAPNCTSADLAGVMAGVGFSLSAYLFTHPDVNEFFTSLKGLPKDEMRAKVENYLDANPQVRAELQGIRQPSADFGNRCDTAW